MLDFISKNSHLITAFITFHTKFTYQMLPINNRLASSISILANQTMGETFFH